MSHLEMPRIVISGRFLSDVSTINNDDANFVPNASPLDLGWNPRGGATLDFYDCRVTGADAAAGAAPASDPVLALAVSGTSDRPSAKMVDLDPDWQMSSQLWGLTVRLFDAKTQELALQGRFAVSEFRDLFVRQLLESMTAQGSANGQEAGGRFVSMLSDVTWGPVAARSPVLTQLKAAADNNELAIVLNTFGYYYTNAKGRHTTGAVVGCIGPRKRGEPKSFVAGRRLQSLALPVGGNPAVLIGPADAIIDSSGLATIDLGHALLISDADGTITDISKVGTALAGMQALEFGLLPGENHKSGDRLKAGAATLFGAIDYLGKGWYKRTGGITSFKIDDAKVRQAGNNPLALFARMADGSHLVLNRETSNGLYVRADNFVHRLDPGDAADVAFYARSYGRPAAQQTIHLAPSQAGNNTPPEAFGFGNTIVTDATGVASLHVTASDPGTPRQPIDGQIYAVGYSPRLDGSGNLDTTGTGLGGLDVVVAHVRSGFPIPDRPEWYRDIQPIMAQFAQIYPVMSRHLFDLADYDAMAKHRKILLLAFGRGIEDPNYMPVTRDLSNNKRATIVKWLQTETGGPAEPLVKGTPPPAGVAAAALRARKPSPMTARARALGEDDIKRAMAQLFARDADAILPDKS
jgi:hypothetical protein